MREFKIELRVDYDDPEKDRIMRKAARKAAQQLIATAVMIADGRKPEIILRSGDFFESEEEINILDESDDTPTQENTHDDNSAPSSDPYAGI